MDIVESNDEIFFSYADAIIFVEYSENVHLSSFLNVLAYSRNTLVSMKKRKKK